VPESGAGASSEGAGAGGFRLDDSESLKAVNSREGRGTLGAEKRCQDYPSGPHVQAPGNRLRNDSVRLRERAPGLARAPDADARPCPDARGRGGASHPSANGRRREASHTEAACPARAPRLRGGR
jgi:hypothetical protein